MGKDTSLKTKKLQRYHLNKGQIHVTVPLTGVSGTTECPFVTSEPCNIYCPQCELSRGTDGVLFAQLTCSGHPRRIELEEDEKG